MAMNLSAPDFLRDSKFPPSQRCWVRDADHLVLLHPPHPSMAKEVPFTPLTKLELASRCAALFALLPGDLQQTGRNMLDEDNRCTAHPVWEVQKQVRTSGLDPEFAEDGNYLWVETSQGDFTCYAPDKDAEAFKRIELMLTFIQAHCLRCLPPPGFTHEQWIEIMDNWKREESFKATERLFREVMKAAEMPEKEIERILDQENPVGTWRKSGFQDRWETVTRCFSEPDAKEWVEKNGHRHGGKEKLQIYVEWLGREPHLLIIRETLLAGALGERYVAEQAKAAGH